MTGSKSSARTRARPTSQERVQRPKSASIVATGGAQGGGRFGSEAGCGELAETLVLMSPDPAVLKRLLRGDDLKVERRGKPVVAVHAGEVAGAIVIADLTRLISCLDRGFKFVFSVNAVNGGRCDGTIHCVGKP